ncbi:hypothetical protein D3C80_1125240 [compost metagenome]
MARQCGLDGDSRRFRVADFADHDDVRVLTQDGAQTSGEGQADLGAHAHLNHAGQVQFDRVLDRDDLALAVVQVGQQAIDGGGLARAGRPSDQEDAVGMFGQTQEALFLFGADAQFGQLRQTAGLAQQTQDDGFAPRARQGRNTQVYLLARHADRLSPVLRQAAFADVHAAEQLDA